MMFPAEAAEAEVKRAFTAYWFVSCYDVSIHAEVKRTFLVTNSKHTWQHAK